MKQRRELFADDDEKIRYFDIAVRNGYDTAGRRDAKEAHSALRQALAALDPVEFPSPAPRTLRAVGLTAGMIDEHLVDLHDDEAFVGSLKEAIKHSILAVPQWEELADALQQMLSEQI